MTSSPRSRPPLPVVVRVSDPITSADEKCGRLPRRHHAEEQPDKQRRAGTEGDDPHVECQRDGRRQQTLRNERWRHAENGGADPRSERAADQRQHDALGQQLPDDAAAAGAERRPDRQLARAHRRAGEQQVGDVGAADEEHESDDAEEQHRREPQIAADDRIVHPLERHAAALVGLRELARETVGDGARSASAASSETPGFMRPTTCSM